MSVGLFKKQITRDVNSPLDKSPLKLFGSKKRKRDLRDAKAKYQVQMDAFSGFDIKNPYADIKNTYAGLRTEFENVFEDLTVNQQQAQFEAQQGQQQRANIMQQMSGAAGASGIAGLAQAMANQGQLATQRASASIGQQERANEMAVAQQAARTQQMEAQREQLIAQGAGHAEMTRMGGEAALQQMEMDRQATMLGMAQQEVVGAQEAIAANKQMWGQIVGSVFAASGQIAGAGSDRKLKHDIQLIKKSPSGLNVYSFKYKDSSFGEGTYQGVMADEVPNYAVIHHPNGYDMVDYNKIDVNFKRI